MSLIMLMARSCSFEICPEREKLHGSTRLRGASGTAWVRARAA